MRTKIPVLLSRRSRIGKLLLLPLVLCAGALLYVTLPRVNAPELLSNVGSNCRQETSHSELIIYRIHDNESLDVCSISSAETILPNQVIVQPELYEVVLNGRDGELSSFFVDAREPGLYRIFHPALGSRQFIVWTPEMAIESLMSDLSYLYAHGNKDDNLSLNELAKASQERKLSVTCGTISRLIQHFMKEFDIESRIVVSVTLEETNGMDDGHIMVEINDDKKWKLFDPDSKSLFGNRDKSLSAADISVEFMPLVGENITLIAPPNSVDFSGFKDSQGVDLSFLEEKSRISDASLTKWYRRVLGRIGVQIDDIFYFVDVKSAQIRERIVSFYPEAKFTSVELIR